MSVAQDSQSYIYKPSYQYSDVVVRVIIRPQREINKKNYRLLQ